MLRFLLLAWRESPQLVVRSKLFEIYLTVDQARAVLYLGYMEDPKVVELTVGPLPNPTNYTILREVPWNTRPPNSAEYAA